MELAILLPRIRDLSAIFLLNTVSDVERPLMSEEQWYLTNCVKNAHMFSPAIAEMMCNARTKIHSLYQLLKQRYLDTTQLNESLYSIKFSVVQPQNKVINKNLIFTAFCCTE